MNITEVRDSGIQGKGVFATTNISKGDIILAIDDSHVVKNVDALTEHQKQYECDWLGEERTVLMQSPEKYINHSCNPNTFVKTTDGVRRVVAMCYIKNGEEITYDYAVNGYYDSDMPCHCGGKDCRGTISSNFFKLPRYRQLEYLPYLDDWFRKKFKKEIEQIK